MVPIILGSNSIQPTYEVGTIIVPTQIEQNNILLDVTSDTTSGGIIIPNNLTISNTLQDVYNSNNTGDIIIPNSINTSNVLKDVVNDITVGGVILPDMLETPNVFLDIVTNQNDGGILLPSSIMTLGGGEPIENYPVYTDTVFLPLTSDETYIVYYNNVTGKMSYGPHDIGHSGGLLSEPTIVNHTNGFVTIGSAEFNTYIENEYSGHIYNYTLPETTFLLTDQIMNYIVASYNNGSPIYKLYADISSLNWYTEAPVYSIYRNGDVIRYISWDSGGLGLSEKLLTREIMVRRFERENGFLISTGANRSIVISSGTAWHGIKRQTYPQLSSSTGCTFYYHVNGIWKHITNATSYNNTQYDNGTNLISISGNKYVVNWVYRSMDNPGIIAYVLSSTSYTTLSAAAVSSPRTDLPNEIKSVGILVGRIIVMNNATTASQVDSSFTTIFSPSSVIEHSSLTGLLNDDHSQYALLSGRSTDNLHINTISEFTSGNGVIFPNIIKSNVITGSSPFIINSTTLNTNLNADLLDGHHSSAFELALGNPSTTGYILTSTALGTRSWIPLTTAVPNSLGEWFEIVNEGLSTEYLRCKKPLAGDYEIMAYADSGQLGSIWENIPIATATSIGGIKVGTTLSISDGVLNLAEGTGFDESKNYNPTGAWNFTQTPTVGGSPLALASSVSALETVVAGKLNSSLYTATDVLTKLRTVDGAGSGINADLVDGYEASAFSLSGHTHPYLPLTGGSLSGSLDITGDLHVTGNITAEGEIAAYIADIIIGTIWDNMPLATETAIGGIKLNTAQFNFNTNNQLTILDSVIAPKEHTHVWADIVSGVPDYSLNGHVHAIADVTGLQTALNAKLSTSLKGAVNGLAELDGSGKVLSSQLPSYVDDVLEYTTLSGFPATGESGKIYIAMDTNLSYRWSGSAYSVISPSLALGETSSTAYRGDRGKVAYDHSQSSHAYLPLAGGTISGVLNLQNANTAIDSDGLSLYIKAGGSVYLNTACSISVTNIGQIYSTLATGTSPFAVTSTTVNTNLNADLLDDQHGSYWSDYRWNGIYRQASDLNTSYTGGVSYWNLGAVNIPPNTGGYGTLLNIVNTGVDHNSSDNWLQQLAFPTDSDNPIFYRHKINGLDFTSWCKLWHSGNSNLSTVDWNAKNLSLAGTLSVTGDTTITGNLHVSGDITADGEVAAFIQGVIGSTIWENMPPATATTLGGIKVGTTLTIADGVLNMAEHTHSSLAGASYVQSSGYATSWNTTNGVTTGAFNTIMGTASAATWLISGTSGGVFRGGIQLLDAGGVMKINTGSEEVVTIGGSWITASLNGNASTASTLATTRTIWGQNFNGSANISGALTGATTGAFSSSVTVGGNLFINTTTYPQIRLNAGPNATTYWLLFNGSSVENGCGAFTVRHHDGTYYKDYSILKPTLTANAAGKILTDDNLNSIYTPFQTLTDAATITWNMANGYNATVTLAGNRTLAITGATSGISGVLIVKQNVSGGNTLTLPAGSKLLGGGTLTLSTTASAIDMLTFTYDGTNYYWSLGKNYA